MFFKNDPPRLTPPTQKKRGAYLFGGSRSSIALATAAFFILASTGVVIAKSKGLRERTEPGPKMFRLPVENTGGRLYSKVSPANPLGMIGADHKPETGKNGIFARATCKDYKGRTFPHCYGSHKGSDFILKGGFKAMDLEKGRVVAAASGEVIGVEDGNFDRCRASVVKMEVTCKGHEKKANFVKIKHDNGYVSGYYHFKKGSIAVEVGEKVSCGDFLGLVGSSGESSLPHLHFEVYDPDGFSVDPFSVDPENSMWVKQDGPKGLPAETCME